MAVDWSYDRAEHILTVRHLLPLQLSTREAIISYFDEGLAYWRQNCGGNKVYILVDYENLTTEPEAQEFYVRQVKRVVEECAITVIRYGGSFGQRTAGRMMAIQMHTPSQMYVTREEAMRVVRGVKKGSIKLRGVAGA